MADRTIGGRGGVVTVVGPPGIGKSRVAREAAALAAGRGVEVFWAFCESHARDIPFRVVTRLLRAGTRRGRPRRRSRPRAGPGSRFRMPTRRICCCSMICSASPTPMCRCPQIDPDARRRRLTALINTTCAGAHRTGAVHHRGCALDRCGQRVDAGRLPHRHSAHPVDGADHLPPRI